MRSLILFWASALLPFFTFGQHQLNGTITDAESGQPLTGAGIILKKTFKATTSDLDGNFVIKGLAAGTYHLKVSYIGYEEYKEKIELDADKEIEVELQPKAYEAGEVTVSATRADVKTPVAYTNIDKEELEEENLGPDLPYLMNLTPSTVATSDAGTGMGYSGLRIRGTDPTRINVTINGIPLNDAESQGVFWVDLPDLASSTDNIQIQRGVGTSTNGAGAFGATINLQTAELQTEAFGETSHSYGSFNTRMHNVDFGSGLVRDHWAFEGRLSKMASDGFIDRATADLQSYYFSGAYYGEKSSLRIITFAGHEVTYQAWNGVPGNILDTNRTFNAYNYPNEVDNYKQTHYQLHYNQEISRGLTFNASLHYTIGKGYFEQYRGNQYNNHPYLFSTRPEPYDNYGLNPITFSDTIFYNDTTMNVDTFFVQNDTISATNLIRRRWLDNDFYGIVYSLNYDKGGKLKATIGGGWNNYLGLHYGEVIWAEYAANHEKGYRYYENDAEKSDFNIYGRANYQFTNQLNAYLDLQYRSITYNFLGFDEDGSLLDQQAQLNFFNPKAGLVYEINRSNSIFASAAVGNKEPNRNDYTESSPASRPEPETLYDYELGYSHRGRQYGIGANIYYMDYHDQLVLTGEINDVGAYTRTNIPSSYRAGIELQTGVKLFDRIDWNANFTYSQNKIENYTEFVDDWDTGGQLTIEHENTDLAFSPNIIAASDFELNLFNKNQDEDNAGHSLGLAFISKYVGKQYIDNTQSEERKLDPYFINDLRLTYSLQSKFLKRLQLTFMVRNLFDVEYETNAWVYRYHFNNEFQVMDGYFPQAGRNYLAGLTLRF